MANTVCITVDNIIERNKRYSFVDTEGQWYGLGFSKPNFEKWDEIQFDYTVNGKYKNVTDGTVEVTNKASPYKGASDKKPTSTDVMSRDDYWARKEMQDVKTQREIRLQASRNAAIEFVRLALENDVLPLSRSKSDKEEILTEYVRNYMHMFYAETFAIRDKSEEALAADEVLDFDDEDSLDDLVS